MKRTFNHIADDYRSKKDGNVAVMFAVTVFVLIAGLAMAIDLSNAYFAKQRLQDTTDAVALMAAKDKSLDTEAKLQATAQALYDATYPNNTGQRIVIESIKREGDKVTISTKNNIDTYFSGVFKTSNLDVGVTSSAVFADKAMDIALVLDTTFSMSGSKLSNLKSAAGDLVQTFDEIDNDNLRVSVVPFAQYVNVGTSRRSAPWLDVPVDNRNLTPFNKCSIKRDVISRTNCRRITRTCKADGVPYDCSYNKCDVKRGKPYEVCRTVKPKAETWQGCVGSRTGGYDERPDYSGRKIPGLFGNNCGNPLQTLSADMTTARSTINAMRAKRSNGATYIPSGILWGWRTLDESVPFQSGAGDVAKTREKVMIVMTDGDNQALKNGTKHEKLKSGETALVTNNKTDKLCRQAKADNVTIYTIAYEVGDAATKTMLSRCATDGGKFFDARNASELNKAFKSIGEALSELRISA